MCQNPRSSLFGCSSFWCETECANSVFIQDHQACGSSRPKWARLVANFKQVALINLTCPGNHKHEPWGKIHTGAKRVFANSLEVHYPAGLGRAIVNAFLTKLGSMGFAKADSVPANPAAQAMSGKQPVTGKLLPIVPEYKTKILVLRDANRQLVWPCPHPCLQHCRLLHSFQVGGMEGVEKENISEHAKKVAKHLVSMAAAYHIGCQHHLSHYKFLDCLANHSSSLRKLQSLNIRYQCSMQRLMLLWKQLKCTAINVMLTLQRIG